MRLSEILEEQETKGTYAAVKFDPATKAAIEKWVENNEVPNPLDFSKLHCTLLYSRKYCPDYEPQGEIDPPWVGTPTGLEVWESRGKLRDEDPKRCLVMTFDCDKLHDRHKELMDEHEATYDFPSYKTHVTLSYDIGDFDEKTLPNIAEAIKELLIVEEYGEDLDLDWAANNAKSDE